MDELCDVTSAGERSSAFSLGCTTSVVLPRALIIILKTIWALFISLASKFSSNAIYETACKYSVAFAICFHAIYLYVQYLKLSGTFRLGFTQS
jgi:hypothetical protein